MVRLRSGRATASGGSPDEKQLHLVTEAGDNKQLHLVTEAGDNQQLHLVTEAGDNQQLHLVTGGGGYAGYHLGMALQQKGHHVKLIDINEPANDIPSGITFEKCDISDYDAVKAALQGAFCVYHLASYGMSGREQLNSKQIYKVNVTGTENIVKACQECNIEHLVYTSTCNVIFGGQQILNGDESLPYFPLEKHPDEYSRSKSLAEQYVLSHDGTPTVDGSTLHTCALRLAGVYGPGEQRHLPRIVGYIEQGLFSVKYGSRDLLVEFLHVDNLVQAHVAAGAALTRSYKHIASGEAYFISDCKPVNNFEFFRPLVEGLGYKYPRLNLPISLVYFIAFLTEWLHWVVGRVYNFQPFLTRTEVYKTGVTHYFSNDKARQHLGYVPTKQNDMESVLKWYLDHGYHRKQRRHNAFMSLLRDLALAVIFSMIVLSYLPTVT